MISRFKSAAERKRARPVLGQIILIAILTVSIGVQAGCALKRTRPGKIVGDSMAPNLMGDHYRAECPDCGFIFPCGIEQSDRRKFLVCPNCGFDKLVRSSTAVKKAMAVEIDVQPDSLERWDPVAFRRRDTDDVGVKRIVGLPGEDLKIRDGNLFVEQQLLQKRIEVQKAMRILVHDSKFLAPNQQRWIPLARQIEAAPIEQAEGMTGWTARGGGYSFAARDSSQRMDWIRYAHQKCYSHRDHNQDPVAIEDSYGFNQSISRDLNPMDEVFVEMELDVSATAVFSLRFDNRGSIMEFQIDVANLTLGCRNTDGSGQTLTIPVPSDVIADGSARLEFSSIDHQLIVLLDDQQLLAVDFRPFDGPVSTSLLSLGASGGPVVASRIRIWRDVFYLGHSGNEVADSLPNGGSKSYLLLGDNAPVSVDSRQWKPGWVLDSEIIGKVKSPINH